MYTDLHKHTARKVQYVCVDLCTIMELVPEKIPVLKIDNIQPGRTMSRIFGPFYTTNTTQWPIPLAQSFIIKKAE